MLFFRLPERRRRCLIPLSALLLGAYYALVFYPLGERSAALDQPLQRAGEDLAFALGQTEAGILDPTAIRDQVHATEQALDAMHAAAGEMAQRTLLREETRNRMRSPFELFDYQYERQLEMDELSRLAGERKVKLEPPVLSGLPQHTTDTRAPALLWAKLEFIHHLLATAIANDVSVIHHLEVASPRQDLVATNSTRRLTVVPLHVELSGSMLNVARFLRSLPLRADELKAAGLPDASPAKPPLYIDRLLVLKQTPLQPDEVRLDLHASGFVLRENEPDGISPPL